MRKFMAIVAGEMREAVPALLFFLVVFHMLLITKNVILEDHNNHHAERRRRDGRRPHRFKGDSRCRQTPHHQTLLR